jgi:hypothetical protein
MKMVIRVLRNCSLFFRDKSSAATATPSTVVGGETETGWDTPD